MALGTTDKEFLIRVKADIDDAVRKMEGFERTLDSQAATVSTLTRSFRLLGPAITGLFTAQTLRGVVNTTLQFQALEQQLRFATGSSAAAAEEIAFLRAETDRLGVNLLSAGDAYAKFAAAARTSGVETEDLRNVFLGVAESARVMGLSADDTAGILRAFQQALAKGKLSAEELQQVAERLPIAYELFARAVGVTTEELGGMLQRGEILTKDILPALGRELRAAVSADVAAASASAAASFERLGNSIAELVTAIGQSGIVDLLADVADAVASVIRAFAGLEQIRFFEASTTDVLEKAQGRLAAVREEIEKMERIAAGEGGFFERTFEYTPEQARENLGKLRAEAERIGANIQQLLFGEPQQVAERLGAAVSQATKRGIDRGPERGVQRDPNEEAVRALEFEAATYGMTAKQIALYRLELQGATQDQLARAAAAIDAVAAEEQFAQALAEIEAQQQAAAEAAAAQNAEMSRQAQYWQDLVNPANAYQRQLEEIEALYASGYLAAETYQEALFRVMEGFEAVGEAATQAEDTVSQFAIQAARNIQSELGDTLVDIMQGNFDDIGDGFARLMQRMVAEAAAARIAEALFGNFGTTGQLGGAVGGFFQSVMGGLFHAGGVVGSGGRPVRMSALVAAQAPRYHAGGIAGLAPDEMPAILQRGEEVITRDDPRHRYNGGGKSVTVIMQLPNVRDVQQFARDEPYLARQAGRAIQREMGKL